MNKTTKVLSTSIAMFAIVGMIGVLNNEAFANPNGIPADQKLVYNFQYIAVPDGTEPSCGNGHVIYTERGSKVQHFEWIHPDNQAEPVNKITISDCKTQSVGGPDGVGGENDPAEILVDEVDKYYIYVKLLGNDKNAANTLNICSSTRSAFDGGDECLLDTVDATKGGFKNIKSSVSNAKLFDADGEDIIYTLTQGDGFKHAQFRIYAEQ